MRVLIAAALVVLTLVLSVIAFDLHQIARTVGVTTGVGPYAVHMTAEQKRQSFKRMVDENVADLDWYLKTSQPQRRTPPGRP